MKTLTQAAQAAGEIRKILKTRFPEIKFSVRSENYSMGNSIRVSYENAMPTKEVEKHIEHFEYGTFDGMEDIYNNDNVIEGLPQTKYLFVNRNISQEIKNQTKADLAKAYGIDINNEQEWRAKAGAWSDQIVYRELVNKTL